MPVARPGEAQEAAEALRRTDRCPEGEGALSTAHRGLAMTTRAAARLVAVGCLMLAIGATKVNSQPDTESANAIMPGCESVLAPQKTYDLLTVYNRGICAGEVGGVWDTAVGLGRVCAPQGVIFSQAVRVVVQFINARPARMHERFTKLAFEALIAAWPCK
jgi:hypothetical protein